MKYNPELKASIPAYFDYVIIVEGKKSADAMYSVGFRKIYTLHETGVPMKERVAQIMESINKKDKVCILTDFDRKGKDLYLLVKPIFQEHGAKLDSSLRGLLLKGQFEHVEEITQFFDKLSKIG